MFKADAVNEADPEEEGREDEGEGVERIDDIQSRQRIPAT